MSSTPATPPSPPPPDRAVKVSHTMPASLAAALRHEAHLHGESTSHIIRAALRHYLLHTPPR